ncbi:MAG: ABC transporter ATP-binding protein [Bradymonadia bacterium]
MKLGPFRRLWAYGIVHRGAVWRASVHSVLNKVFDLAPPALIGLAVDSVVNPPSSILYDFGYVTLHSQLLVIAGLTIVVWGLESVFEFAYKVAWRNLAQEIQHQLRQDVYCQVQALDAAWFARQRSGRLMSILNDDINQLERFLDSGANDVLQVGCTVITVGAIFFAVNTEVAALAVLPIPLILWGSFIFQRKIAPRYADVREDASALNAALGNRLIGIDTIKSFTAEQIEADRIAQLSEIYRRSNASAIRLSSAFSPLIRMAILIGFVGTILRGGMLVGEGVIAVGTYSMLVFLTQRLLWPLTRLGATFDLYQRAMASAERALDLLDLKPEVTSGSQPIRLPVKGDVDFVDVRFAYPDRARLFDGLNLTISAGQTIGLVGGTGSGKTTLTRLLLGLYSLESGSICIDGQPLETLDTRSVRREIGLVSQSVYLFPGTIAENILYGRPDASFEEVRAAARDAECLSFIESLAHGFESQIGERGILLSGGQAQRLSIARCLLKDPPIVIFDEATSSIDNETERAIQRTFRRLSGAKTTIMIAHRLSSVRHAHQIIVLDDGQIVECGTHDTLVENGGRYAHMWSIQTGRLE